MVEMKTRLDWERPGQHAKISLTCASIPLLSSLILVLKRSTLTFARESC